MSKDAPASKDAKPPAADSPAPESGAKQLALNHVIGELTPLPRSDRLDVLRAVACFFTITIGIGEGAPR